MGNLIAPVSGRTSFLPHFPVFSVVLLVTFSAYSIQNMDGGEGEWKGPSADAQWLHTIKNNTREGAPLTAAMGLVSPRVLWASPGLYSLVRAKKELHRMRRYIPRPLPDL